MSTLEMFGKTGSVLRALWSEMPEVRIAIIHRVRGYGRLWLFNDTFNNVLMGS